MVDRTRSERSEPRIAFFIEYSHFTDRHEHKDEHNHGHGHWHGHGHLHRHWRGGFSNNYGYKSNDGKVFDRFSSCVIIYGCSRRWQREQAKGIKLE